MSDEKSKALAAALAQIEKNFGKGSIMKMTAASRKKTLMLFPPAPSAWTWRSAFGGLPAPRG